MGVLLRQKERKIVQVSVGERSVVATMSQSADDAVQGSCPPSPVFPKFSNIPETLSPTFQKHFPTYVGGLFVSTPHNFVSTPAYANAAEKLYHFEPKKDDVWIMTFPKSGTTWMQEMVWLLTHNNDFEKAKQSLHVRSPFFEMGYLLPKFLTEQYERDIIVRKSNMPVLGKLLEILSYCKLTDVLRPMVKKVIDMFMGNMMPNIVEMDEMTGPRIIKCHLPFYLLHPQLLDTSEVVYVARNPKDVIVSYYYYHKLMDYQQFTGNIETFAEYFIEDKMFNGPYFPHVFEGWSKRHHPNLHFVFYEDLKTDLRGEIVKIATFLGKSLTDEQLTKLTEHLGFNKMKNNAAVNNEIGKEFGILKQKGYFIRKGITGDWKNHFSPEMNSRLDAWITKNTAGTDIRFVTELPNQE